MQQPKILDNKQFGKVGEELKDSIKGHSKLSIISAYFTIFAYKELSKELNKVDKLRFLFTEPTFVNKNEELVRSYFIDRTLEHKISGNEFEIKMRNEMNQSSIAKECAEWIKNKVEFKSLINPNSAQQRLIYIENKEDNVSINGSVDFTTDGLGFSPSNRMDMNTCMYGKDYTNQFLTMFNNIWEDDSLVEDVKTKVLEQMQLIYNENTPEFIYFVTLYNIFKGYLGEITEENIVKTKIGFKETEVWNKLYKFQKDGVIGAIDKIEKHRGCIIADSVGLGKTFSDTLVNNRMNDLKNQINFITEGKDDVFESEGITSVELTLRKAQLVFNKWTELEESERTLDTFMEMMDMDYFKLLDTVTIARSRKHIEKYYDIAEIGKFPKRLKPINIKSSIDEMDEFPSLEHVNKVIRNLNLSTYSPLKYVLPEKRSEYDKKYDTSVKGGQSVFRQADREQSLVSLMRVNILKRMESSINSFGITIGKLLKQIDYTLEKIERKQMHFDTSLNILDIEIDDDTLEDSLIGHKVKVLIQDMDLIKWKQDLEDDKKKLEELIYEAAKIVKNRDAKLNSLREKIIDKINNPLNEGNKKIIIFSAFADTTNYLYESLSPWLMAEFKLNTALVTGSGDNKCTLKGVNKKDLNAVLTNFSPKSKEREKIFPDMKEEIDILIATDCISEGQNLQDCDYLINYDIHWNPVRIIQRFGRIDRLGSKNDRIQLVNFWPNMELDEYINLEARVTGRMMLLDISATGEENIIDNSGKSKMNDLEYRKKQLKQLQDDVVDLEDISGGISITDLTMNDFKMDLMEYMKNHKLELERAPLGMYAVATVDDEELKNQIKPGIIFTLKQVNHNAKPEESNSLYPYYMIYVYEDGTVRYNYIHTKKILDFYRKLCSGKNEVLKDIVKAFNDETNDGKDMNKYSSLLEDAIDNIIGKKEEKGVASLFSKGGTTIQKSLFKGIEDFELVSFLVIK